MYIYHHDYQASSRGLSVSCDKEEENVGEDDGGELGPHQEEVSGRGATQPGDQRGEHESQY